MTKEQKRLIDQYRQSGMKYSEIARTIGLPESTVKSYCYRNPVTNPLPVPRGQLCPQCGKPISSSKYRPRRFCSDACRNKYWLTHHLGSIGPTRFQQLEMITKSLMLRKLGR